MEKPSGLYRKAIYLTAALAFIALPFESFAQDVSADKLAEEAAARRAEASRRPRAERDLPLIGLLEG